MPPASREKPQAVIFKLSEAQKETIRRFWDEWSRSSQKAPHSGPVVTSPVASSHVPGGAEPEPSNETPRPI